MPGFILNVQGLEVLFKLPEGEIDAATRISTGSIETMLSGLTGENKNPGRLMGAIDTGDGRYLSPVFPSAVPFFGEHEWCSLDAEVESKGGALISKFTC